MSNFEYYYGKKKFWEDIEDQYSSKQRQNYFLANETKLSHFIWDTRSSLPVYWYLLILAIPLTVTQRNFDSKY